MGTSYDSGAELATDLRRAAAAHGRHEAEIGHADENRPDWYAQYMVDENTRQREDNASGATA